MVLAGIMVLEILGSIIDRGVITTGVITIIGAIITIEMLVMEEETLTMLVEEILMKIRDLPLL